MKTIRSSAHNFSEEERKLILQLNFDSSRGGGYWCEWCYFTSCLENYFEVDHLIPVARGGARDLDNACVLCTACNQSKNQYNFPRHGVGLAYRIPNQNMAPPDLKPAPLTWDEFVEMARRKGKFRRQE